MHTTIRVALDDMRAAWQGRRTALAFAAEDVASQYRRTALGPLWSLISYLLFVLSIVFVFRSSHETTSYLGYVACGILIFNYMSDTLVEGVSLFGREKAFIQGTTLPISTYVVRLTMRSTIRAAYPLAAAIGLLLIDGLFPNLNWIYALLGLVLILLTAPAVALVFAIVGVIFPDTSFVLQNIMRLAFFLTPIIWDHAGDSMRLLFYHWNPFTHFIAIVRSPILSGDPAVISWVAAGAIAAFFWVAAFLLLGNYRDRIVFMV